MNRKICLLMAIFVAPFLLGQVGGQGIWQDVNERSLTTTGTRYIVPNTYRTVAMDRGLMRNHLSKAPAAYSGQFIELTLPGPNGAWETFRIDESPIMEAELANKFPEIRTYRGFGVTDPTAYMRFDMTPQGFHAMVLTTQGTWMIDPYFFENPDDVYVSYYRQDYPYTREEPWFCDTTNANLEFDDLGERFLGGVTTTGTEMLNYRVAISATGEYSTFHGGTIPSVLAAITTALNRVNTVYNHDVAIQMNLVANNDQIIFLNSGTDPFSNSDGFAMLGQNQTTIDNIIGSANYDIGHVFSTGGGGIALLRGPCRAGQKAQGVTGLQSPVGDVFYIDFVAHEMGHQWGGRHTFNGTSGFCNGNRSATAAFEPGSGSTIQAYAGICGSENLQNNSDAFFHSFSMIEIIEYSRNDSGNSCAVAQPLSNQPPQNLDAGNPVTLPIQTPFMLSGSATDANSGDTLLYNFEQFDLGTAAPPNTDNGNRPILRSFFYSVNPYRIVPRLSDVLNNTSTFGESLPTTSRILSFRMSVRDGNGGTNSTLIQHMTDATAGPFLVTALNAGGTVDGNSMLNVTWDVANTDNGNVNCQNVDIWFSIDGGMTFSELVAEGTPNDGSEMVVVPNVDTTQARIIVMAADNLFFDINNANFTINMASLLCPTDYETWLTDASAGGFIDSNGNGIVDVADFISCFP